MNIENLVDFMIEFYSNLSKNTEDNEQSEVYYYHMLSWVRYKEEYETKVNS